MEGKGREFPNDEKAELSRLEIYKFKKLAVSGLRYANK
jgi:hypothetical protein